MLAVKERMTMIIHDQPEDSTYDQILRELAFFRMIDCGCVHKKNSGRTTRYVKT